MKINKKDIIRVLIVDDQTLIRKATFIALGQDDDIEMVGECSDGNQVCDFLKANAIDIILMDINMKHMGGIEATKLSILHYPLVKVIALTSNTEQYYEDQMFLAGASAYIIKGTDPEQIIQKIIEVVSNRPRQKQTEIHH